MSTIQFEAKLGLTSPEPVIVDTGALVSLLPRYIANQIITKPMGEAMLQDVVPKQDCALPVTIAKIQLRLTDFSSVTGLIDTTAYIADSDDLPLVLGFEEMLGIFDIFISYPKRTAYWTHRQGGAGEGSGAVAKGTARAHLNQRYSVKSASCRVCNFHFEKSLMYLSRIVTT